MKQKEYIGQTIKKLRLENKWSAQKLASMMDEPISGKTITSWENGRTQPDADKLINLCEIFGVGIEEFYLKSPQYLKAVSTPDSYVSVPLLGHIAAGEPIEMENVSNTFPVPAEVMKKYPKAFLLEVQGESMSKVLPNGSYALINPTKEIINGKPYAVCINGYDATIKRVKKLNNGYELIPDSNDPTYRSKIYDYWKDDTEEITIIGEVVHYVIPYDFVI